MTHILSKSLSFSPFRFSLTIHFYGHCYHQHFLTQDLFLLYLSTFFLLAIFSVETRPLTTVYMTISSVAFSQLAYSNHRVQYSPATSMFDSLSHITHPRSHILHAYNVSSWVSCFTVILFPLLTQSVNFTLRLQLQGVQWHV